MLQGQALFIRVKHFFSFLNNRETEKTDRQTEKRDTQTEKTDMQTDKQTIDRS